MLCVFGHLHCNDRYMVFVLASPMCFHHNNVCNDNTLLWYPMCFFHSFVCNDVMFAPFFVSMFSLNTRQLC